MGGGGKALTTGNAQSILMSVWHLFSWSTVKELDVAWRGIVVVKTHEATVTVQENTWSSEKI